MISHKRKICRQLYNIYKFIDFKQPEVKWAILVSISLETFFALISLYSNFPLFESLLDSIFQCIIAGLISLLGMAIAGVAIVITLFSTEQVKIIEELKKGAYEILLEDFHWFALVAILEIALFIAIEFLIKLPYNLPSIFLFYLIIFYFTYSVFYVLFYGSSLIGNCIKLSKLRCTIDEISSEKKSKFEATNELVLDFLISKLLSTKNVTKKDFYIELISIVKESELSNKDELIQYLYERYIKK